MQGHARVSETDESGLTLSTVASLVAVRQDERDSVLARDIVVLPGGLRPLQRDRQLEGSPQR
jgi:hypothetical protein